jgi:hypothetical protein
MHSRGESCLLCGCEKLFFEPPVYYCNGKSVSKANAGMEEVLSEN